ncbi:MAG TPA: hypothetical protein V6D47_08575 [Oscillatoriaceae cyanobacterium]
MLDLRMPIGILFSGLGALLAAYGLVSNPAMYQISLGYNLNLLWGGCMLVFGVAMFAWQKLDPVDEAPREELSTIVPGEAQNSPL